MCKTHPTNTAVFFQMHPIWQESCLWWVLQDHSTNLLVLFFLNIVFNSVSFPLNMCCWMKPDEPKGWSESMWCIHVWFDGQETTVQVKRELPHQHISRFGSADVFWWGNRFPSLEENVIVHLMLFLHRDTWICTYNVVHLAGGILRDWQQKPELWEKNIAMHHSPSGYSRWCDVLLYDERWESIHRRGGIKIQFMDRTDARLERYERCYKVTRVPFFVTQLYNCGGIHYDLSVFHLTLFQATTSCP